MSKFKIYFLLILIGSSFQIKEVKSQNGLYLYLNSLNQINHELNSAYCLPSVRNSQAIGQQINFSGNIGFQKQINSSLIINSSVGMGYKASGQKGEKQHGYSYKQKIFNLNLSLSKIILSHDNLFLSMGFELPLYLVGSLHLRELNTNANYTRIDKLITGGKSYGLNFISHFRHKITNRFGAIYTLRYGCLHYALMGESSIVSYYLPSEQIDEQKFVKENKFVKNSISNPDFTIGLYFILN